MTDHTSTHPHRTRPPTAARPTPSGAADAHPAAAHSSSPQPPRPSPVRPTRRVGDRLAGRRRLGGVAAVASLSALAVLAAADPALAAPPQSLNEVIGRITRWLVGLAAGLATLFLTYGAVRYLSAGGDPGNVEKAKTGLRSAAIGYGLALLAPLVVKVLTTFVS